MPEIQEIDNLDFKVTLELDKYKYCYILLDSSIFTDVMSDVASVSPYCQKRWLWEDTILDEHKRAGPLLLCVDSIKDPLIEYYFSVWSQDEKGILFVNAYSVQDTLMHLQKILFVQLPDGNEARFRIYDPRRLAGVISALTEKNLQNMFSLLGKIYWREPCFDTKKLLSLDLSSIETKQPKKQIKISGKEIELAEKYEVRLFVRSISRMLQVKYGVSKEESDDQAVSLSRNAYSYGLQSESSIRKFISISLENTELMKTPMMNSILEQQVPSKKKIVLIKNYVDYCNESEVRHA